MLGKAWTKALAGFDICHLHYLDDALTEPLRYLPSDTPVVLSLWGSDLMDQAGTECYARQLAVCDRADIITVRSLALREIFLSKFGRRFLPRIRIAKFGVALFDNIDRLTKPESRAACCAHFNIDPSKTIVCLGHSGCPRDRHLALIHALDRIADQLAGSATFIVPMTYRTTPDYLARVHQAAAESRLDLRIVTEYMSADEVSVLRLATDILVLLPEQDSLSGAMCECLYAGSLVITGAWLPYTEFWDRDIYVRRIANLNDLPAVLLDALVALPGETSRLQANRAKIRPLADYAYSISEWTAAYDAAIASRAGPA